VKSVVQSGSLAAHDSLEVPTGLVSLTFTKDPDRDCVVSDQSQRAGNRGFARKLRSFVAGSLVIKTKAFVASGQGGAQPPFDTSVLFDLSPIE